MKPSSPYFRSFWMALLQYFNQPILDRKNELILNPFEFYLANKVQFLEHCLTLDYSSEKPH